MPTAARDRAGSERAPLEGPSVLDLIGKTPMVEITRVTRGFSPRVRIYAKLEGFNPGGSVKDRETLELVDRRGAAMVLTGERHFRH